MLVVLAMSCALPRPSPATEPDDNVEEPWIQRCINSRAIRSTDVLNDDAIVFRTIGGDFFLNRLPRSCRGLSRDRRFTFDLYERRLCSSDRIRVLMESGSSMIEGRSCKLGEFRRLTVDEVEYIYSPEPKVPEPEPVEPAVVEELDVETEEVGD